jgi:hypothetical protein
MVELAVMWRPDERSVVVPAFLDVVRSVAGRDRPGASDAPDESC